MPIAFHKPDNHAALLEGLASLCRNGRGTAAGRVTATPSGLAVLDAVLPDGGWPRGAVTELMPDAFGVGEIGLLLPALASLSQAGQPLAWVAPPQLPCAMGLAQGGIALAQLLLVAARDDRATLWAAEQALRCSGLGAVLLWPAAATDRCVRRLQLAAEAGGTSGFLFRPATAAAAPSPAALRLRLRPRREGLEVRIIKARGGRPHALVVHPAAAAGG
jgi:cell division inhibitor SulA/protein ImuA